MAAAPKYKIYTPAHGYIAACKFAEDAAALVAIQGDGAEIRDIDHRTVLFKQGTDGDAGESYDAVAEIVRERLLSA